MVYDFHTHSVLSDGVLLPTELVRRAWVNGYAAIGIADHASAGNMEGIVSVLLKESRLVARYWDIRLVVGVELTHVPPESIEELSTEAKLMGAELVVVHGETPVEPVLPGTNLAAVVAPSVDILAHPGLITLEAARLAAQHQVFLEITTRQGHCLTNGHVVRTGRLAGASFLLNTDTHTPDNLLTEEFAGMAAAGAGLEADEIAQALVVNPQALLARMAR